MAVFGKDQTQPATRPHRDLFNEGYAAGIEAGIEGKVPTIELTDFVRKLSTLPIEQWVAIPELEYGCGLLSGWLPSLAQPQPTFQPTREEKAI